MAPFTCKDAFMHSQPFGMGDMVRLKRGGPPMTVQLLTGILAYCVWYEREEVRTNAFEIDLLEVTSLKPGEPRPPALPLGPDWR